MQEKEDRGRVIANQQHQPTDRLTGGKQVCLVVVVVVVCECSDRLHRVNKYGITTSEEIVLSEHWQKKKHIFSFSDRVIIHLIRIGV